MAHDGLGRYYCNRNRITLVAMKASELMLGDLLTFKDCLKDGVFTSIKVCELHDYNNEILVSLDGDTACDLIELDDEIVPIPLTPEILEKNGFECRGAWAIPGEDIGLRQDGDSFGLLPFYADYTALAFCHICYVHELQHAIRLCGISKEIIL